MHNILLYDEYRLIQRNEDEVNGAWRGAHLLVFFLAFVFGSFCTFCFHMLIYMFDEKCVLFPKILSLTSIRHSIIYEFIPSDKEHIDVLPVDFLSTQWSEQATCHLPTYVPLVSGIFGLVWTTMFLMSSSGSRHLTGLQRQWRVLPTVFIFSIAMASMCIYTSSITYSGLMQLCDKLSEITGSSTCSYTVNVATLAYERRIRGVYQAIRLTILSAWLHTSCWIISVLLSILRVLLGVDFQLIRVKVELRGDINTLMENEEKLLRTTSPSSQYVLNEDQNYLNITKYKGVSIGIGRYPSLYQRSLYQEYGKNKHFIIDMVYDLLNTSPKSMISSKEGKLSRMFRMKKHRVVKNRQRKSRSEEAVLVVTDLVDDIRENVIVKSSKAHLLHDNSKRTRHVPSEANLTEEMKEIIKRNKPRQVLTIKDDSDDSNVPSTSAKYVSKSKMNQTVPTHDTQSVTKETNMPNIETDVASSNKNTVSKETQTQLPKDKQD